MPGDRRPVEVRLVDQRPELVGSDPLRLEVPDTPRRPGVDLVADRIRSRLRVPSVSGGTEIGTGVQDPRSGPVAPIDRPPQRLHSLGVHLARGERRRHAVRQEDRRVRTCLVHTARVEEIHGIMGVEVREARQDVPVVVQLDDRGVRGDLLVGEGPDTQQLAAPDQDARVADQVVPYAVEQPAAPDHRGRTGLLGHESLRHGDRQKTRQRPDRTHVRAAFDHASASREG